MILIKCKCGCIVTVQEKTILDPNGNCRLSCQNCNNEIILENRTTFSEFIDKLSRRDMSAQIIPDNAKISISFEA